MLTFRGQSLQETEDPDTSRYWFDLIKGLPYESPEVRGEDIVAPGRAGRYAGNRVLDRHELLIEGFIRGFGQTKEERSLDWHTVSSLILPVFALDTAPGSLVVGPGTIEYLGLVSDWDIEARTLDQMAGPILSRTSYQTWSFKLESIDGLWWQEESS